MKRSHTQDNMVLRDDEGTAYGVVLGAAGCGQHEGGVERIQSRFGMAGGDSDFAGHTAKWDLTDRMRLVETEHERRDGRRKVVDRGLALTTGYSDPAHLAEMLRRYDDAPVTGAWDDGDFAIAGYGGGEAIVRMVADGVALSDIAIWIGGTGGNPFARGGLVIARASLVPPALVATFDESQADARAMKAAAVATGIEERLGRMPLSHGRFGLRPWYALAPRWTPEARKGDTAHPVVFFLNPTDGERSNHGWFTVEELDQWMVGKGPIPKEAA